MFLGEIQDHHHSRNARHEGRLSVQMVGEIDDIHGTRKIRHIVRPSQRLEQLHAKLAKFVPEINTWTLLYNRAIEKHSGAQNQPNSLSQKIIDQGCATGLYNPMDKRHKKYKACTHPNPRHDAICVVDMDGAQQENFEFYHTLNGCVVCCDTIPKEYIKNLIRIRDLRQVWRRSGTHTVKRTLVTVPWKKTKSTWIAKVIGKDGASQETRCVIEEQVPRTKWQLTPTLDLQKKRNFDEKKDSSIVQCQQCDMNKIIGTVFGSCGAKIPNLSEEQEEQAQTLLQEGFAYIQDHTQLEMRPRKLRGNIHGQNMAQQQ